MKKIIHCYNSKELLFSLIEFFESDNTVLILTAENTRVSTSIINKISELKHNYRNRIFINYVDVSRNNTILRKLFNKIKLYAFLADISFRFAFRKKRFYFFNITKVYEILKFRSENSLLEHGSGTYSDRTMSWKGDRLFNNSFCGGLSSRINYVLLQKPELAPEAILEKVRKYDVYAKFKKINVEHQKTINDIFSLDLSIDYKNVLITQHYSESGYFSESEKVDIYKKIIHEFNLDSVCIKPHPRETTDYKSFIECEVIDKYLPFELLLLNDINFDNVITISSSTGLIDSDKTKVHVLGDSYDKRIYDEEVRREKEDKIINVNKDYTT
ncbi:hypothetical protein BIY22_12990 [Vibrio panuliri]|uniref:Lipooligosaccharide sialyltransferase n=1 Tax=Vibrio panuliri TaxID=1381081 RepID=A0A1Q9HAL6_9VIBR|nr:glycosyltransferase family 52 [Vibrio panuliri]OLQ86159.1 hypothetical protein BIY22_12990 [Vibrio panuliri]